MWIRAKRRRAKSFTGPSDVAGAARARARMQMRHDVEIIPDNLWQMDTCANEILRVQLSSLFNILAGADKPGRCRRGSGRGGTVSLAPHE